MKRILAIAVSALAFANPSMAQNSINDVIALLKGDNAISCNYSYALKGDFPLKSSGTALLHKHKYYLNENGIETYCDGSTVWTVDRKAKEVLVSKSEGSIVSRLEDFEDITISRYTGKTLSCTLKNEAHGINIDFNAENISISRAPEDSSAFIFDTSKLGSDWIITDLR
ncbi:MAG: hypothetical protein GX899_03290 [Rikenellaceae bacterium]|jgi:outer membrane lipoprotein-sorting protein|nr:hypothetical protein [Rikenellaceae bacterium]